MSREIVCTHSVPGYICAISHTPVCPMYIYIYVQRNICVYILPKILSLKRPLILQPRPYSFQYEVRDPPSGNDYGQQETSDGNGVVRGEYRVLLPDSRTQIVRYTADDVNGYRADVRYEGQARTGTFGYSGNYQPGIFGTGYQQGWYYKHFLFALQHSISILILLPSQFFVIDFPEIFLEKTDIYFGIKQI